MMYHVKFVPELYRIMMLTAIEWDSYQALMATMRKNKKRASAQKKLD